MSEWQPIETAPKDRRFLACRVGREIIATYEVVLWDDSPSAGGKSHPWGVAAMPADCAFPKNYFTHWMPLPEPPSSDHRRDTNG